MCDADVIAPIEIRDKIRSLIKDIEKRENITVIFCVEAGSRAWNMPSADSDYDVRFVYLHEPTQYLALSTPRDTIEYHEDNIDIHGIDVRKAIHYIYIGEPSIYEWAFSPIQYKTKSAWKDIEGLAFAELDVGAVGHKYYGIAKTAYYSDIRGITEVRVKKYLYCVRSLLACQYVLEKKEPVPLNMQLLMSNYLPESLLSTLQKYLSVRGDNSDAILSNRKYELEDFVTRKMSYLENLLYPYSRASKPVEPFDSAYMKVVLRELWRHGYLASFLQQNGVSVNNLTLI